MVVMSIESFQEQQDRVSLYIELEKAEIEIANGGEGKDFFEFPETLSRSVHGKA